MSPSTLLSPTRVILLSLCAAVCALGANALPAREALPPVESSATGEVRIPLDVYEKLLAALQGPDTAPAHFALSNANAAVTATAEDDRISAHVQVSLNVQILESRWTLVPVLPAGTAVTTATIDGRPIQFVPTPQGLSWITEKAGDYLLTLEYRVDATSYASGFSLPVPLPFAPSTQLSAIVPGSGIHAAVVPATGLRTETIPGNRTRIHATIPTASAVQISWQRPAGLGLTVSRAAYAGQLSGDAVSWTAEFTVEGSGARETLLPLLPRGVTLSGIEVDGEEATIRLKHGRFAVPISGEGHHSVVARFQVPLRSGDGSSQVALEIPEVPVSRFELTLPGKKDISVSPRASVTTAGDDDATHATVYVPMTQNVTFSWEEAIPEDLTAQMQANATLYHLAHAEEGVLHVRAIVAYEITRGEAKLFEIEVPDGVQINRIWSESGYVKDWRWGETGSGPGPATVFLDRPIKGDFQFQIHYERLFGTDEEASKSIDVPLLGAAGVHRQRGMVALLSGPDLALNPVSEQGASKVGENQLPAAIRNTVSRTVAHTYKYFNDTPVLVVQAAVPERKAGKFDAQVDTLLSLGEVALKGSASVEVNVKSGSIMELGLALPAGVNVLGLTGPSIRTHEVTAGESGQNIDIAFTREMEGQFRLELQYERILVDNDPNIRVPHVTVAGAEVEHGRVAVEALTAVEVQALQASHLTSLDINELPRQLVLKTTNPILLAYKYLYADPAWDLTLKVTRHRELEVQQAVIETARYQTLFTRDGIAVTRAAYLVRNSRKQFLRIDLPQGSEVWSVFVSGRAEKPAAANGGSEDSESILVKLINSTDGFPVEIVYAMPVERMGSFGRISGNLPRPQMVVTHSYWDVFLPGGVEYREPSTNMEIVVAATHMDAAAMKRSADELRRASAQQGPLHISVPARGIHMAFEKLYAGQAEDGAGFVVAYAAVPDWMPRILGAAGALLFWLGPLVLAFGLGKPSRGLCILGMAAGVAVLAADVALFDEGLTSALIVSALAAATLLVLGAMRARRPHPTAEELATS